jgi:hypothetical protein
MKKFLLASVFILGLAGCDAQGKLDPGVISIVQQDAVQVCGFLPTVSTVANILQVGVLTVPIDIASAICQAVQPPATSAKPKGVAPTATISGVKIDGKFVR